MLNDYIFGGYLIWAAPEYKVFVDGRADVFEWTGVLADYKKWLFLESDPHELLDKYHIDFCLLLRDAPMSRVIAAAPWLEEGLLRRAFGDFHPPKALIRPAVASGLRGIFESKPIVSV